MYKLVLSSKGFPNRFDNHINLPDPDPTLTTRENAEIIVIESFNNYNSKLKISNIEYQNLEDVYGSEISEYTSSGLIVLETDIISTQDNRDYYLNDGYIINMHNKYEKVSAYVYLCPPNEGSRNIFVSQTIFPSLINQMKHYIDSPSYTLTNKPVYFVNLVNKDYSISTGVIARHFTYIQNAGIHLIDIAQAISYEFNNSLENILSKYLSQYLDDATQVYNYSYKDTESYSVDVRNKVLTLKKETIESAIALEPNGNYNFVGSNEKFYWVECIPLVIMASRQNYRVDISEYEQFIHDYRPYFAGRNNDKFDRCEWILEYFKKII